MGRFDGRVVTGGGSGIGEATCRRLASEVPVLWVETPPTRAFLNAVEGIRANMERANTLGRLAQPDGIAAAVAFLASDDASFENGSVYMVDGGAHAGKQVGLIGAD